MGNLQIRDARKDDLDSILQVTLSAYQQYSAVMPPEHWQGYRQGTIATLTEDTVAERIVAEQEGVVVGSALLYPAGTIVHTPEGNPVSRKWPEVRLLAVAPAARGQGVGRALMEACALRARKAGAPALSLHTTDMMREAMRLYEHMGYVRAPEIDFKPSPELTVKGFVLKLEPQAEEAPK